MYAIRSYYEGFAGAAVDVQPERPDTVDVGLPTATLTIIGRLGYVDCVDTGLVFLLCVGFSLCDVGEPFVPRWVFRLGPGFEVGDTVFAFRRKSYNFV